MPSAALTRSDLLAIAALAAVVAALTVHWAPRSYFSPDALFYQSRVEQIRGTPEQEALDQTWGGALASGITAAGGKYSDPEWITYSYAFYQRRVVVPALAAAVYPIAGEDSLEVVAIVGVFAFMLLLYLLLRQRFSPLACGLAIVACLAWPATSWAYLPLTESWGLALVCLALLAALLAIERDARWLWLWGVTVLALSLTRDYTPVVLVAALAVTALHKNRRSLQLVASGIVAALPAPLIAGSSYRELAAYSFSNNQIPNDSSWSFIASRYAGEVGDALRGNISFVFASDPRLAAEGLPLAPLTLLMGIGVVVLVAVTVSTRSDSFAVLMTGSLAGAVAYWLLLPQFSFLRYELAFLPAAAAGLALAVDLAQRASARAGDFGVEHVREASHGRSASSTPMTDSR